jgi:hypothetical protein
MTEYCDNLKNDVSKLNQNYSFTHFFPPGKINASDLKKCYSPPGSQSQSSPVITMSDISKYQGRKLMQLEHTHESCKMSATFIQSRYLLYLEFLIKRIEENGGVKQGLPFKIINEFYSSDPKFFLKSNSNHSTITTDFTNLQTSTNGILNQNSYASYSIEWYGYFKPNVTGLWNFKLSSDTLGICFLWLGDDAINDYETTNASIVGPNIFSLNLHINKYYPIRIQYGNQSYSNNNNFSLSISGPTGIDGVPLLCALYNQDGSLFEKSLMYYSLNEIDKSLTDRGLFSCYINDIFDNNVKQQLKQSANDESLCNSTFKDSGKKVHYNSKNNNSQYLYRVQGNPLMNNKFLVNKTDKILTAISPYDMSLNNNDYYQLPNYIPLSEDGNLNLSYKQCRRKCNEDPTCTNFFHYKKKNETGIKKDYCSTNSDSFFYFQNQLKSSKTNVNISNASLNVRNKNLNLPTTDYRSKIQNKNFNNYDSYKDYQLLDVPLIINDHLHGLSKSHQGNIQACKTEYIGNIDIGNNNIRQEGFDNHGYANSSTVINNNNDIIGNIIQKQIQPMIEISQDYKQLQTNINQNYYDISSQIYKITNAKNTGIRDILSNDINNTYDYSGNYLKYNTKKPRKEDALKDDVNIMILEQNNLFMLGTITIATLLIAAIYFGRE